MDDYSPDPKKKLNLIVSEYQKQIKDPNWKIGKQKDLDAFSKGAQESGVEEFKNGLTTLGAKIKKSLPSFN